MDPERVRAYLQVACAGLGFDIGEVWWTSNDSGTSTVAAIEPSASNNTNDGEGQLVPSRNSSKPRFVQLYTSKSYENRRADLVNPPETERDHENSTGLSRGIERSSSSENLQKHVLSPRLVEAISKTTQVVWANTEKQEGLIGRSDIRLQTAVGMPVAMDANGNMCCVVMFSGSHLQSTDDAMGFLQSITQSATASSIPCLLPVFDSSSSGMKQLPPSHHEPAQSVPNALGEGVTARFVSLDDNKKSSSGNINGRLSPDSDSAEVPSENNLNSAPKDTFGIPMLPSLAELGGTPNDSSLEVFDEASYGIWTTIMETLAESGDEAFDNENNAAYDMEISSQEEDPSLHVVFATEPGMKASRKERLQEFCGAFLGMSVFDLADVWIPAGDEYPDSLRHVISMLSSSSTNENLTQFAKQSESVIIKGWMGAVGRAYSSGNPVWSTNETALVDPGRATMFAASGIQTVLAVPVFSGKEILPTCVVSCYSLVRSGSVPFVLRFVQQALRLLWDGLDHVKPRESVIEEKVWKDVAPSDLGEMAADVEMQQHFISRKRPRQESFGGNHPDALRVDPESTALSLQMQSVSLPGGEKVNVPLQLPPETPIVPIPEVPMKYVQDHVLNAVRSASEVVHSRLDHVSVTNAHGTKRAHIAPNHGHLPSPQPLHMPQLPNHIIHSQQAGSQLQPPVTSNGLPIPGGAQAVATVSTIHPPNFVAPTQPHHPSVLQPQPSGVLSAQTPVSATPTLNEASLTAAQQQLLLSQAAANPTAVSYVSVNGRIFAATPVTAAPTGPQPTTMAAAASPVLSAYVPPGTATTSGKVCRIDGCNAAAVSRRPYCTQHSGNRLCEHEGCTKCAQGKTMFCIAHGGGRRCTFHGCDKGARDKFFCAAHGGGKRCKTEGCSKSAVGGSNLCTAHGGGRRCDFEGCGKSAQSSTNFCVKHGGGKKCVHEGCEKVARGRTQFCAAHGGGIRCKLEGCNRVAIGKAQLCRAHGGGGGGGNQATAQQPTPAVVSSSSMFTSTTTQNSHYTV